MSHKAEKIEQLPDVTSAGTYTRELPDDVDVVEEGLSGTVYHEYHTCGDETCSCMTDGPKHGPYAYRRTA